MDKPITPYLQWEDFAPDKQRETMNRFLFQAARNEGCYACAIGTRENSMVAPAVRQGFMSHSNKKKGWKHYYLTDAGIEYLRQTVIKALQVDFPGQPPLILKDPQEFMRDVEGGQIDATFDCELDKRLGAPDGAELFKVSIKEIDLYALATLPEWEPV
jgi:hypothetical protein